MLNQFEKLDLQCFWQLKYHKALAGQNLKRLILVFIKFITSKDINRYMYLLKYVVLDMKCNPKHKESLVIIIGIMTRPNLQPPDTILRL